MENAKVANNNDTTLCSKKTRTQTFVHISANCVLIFKIFAALESALNLLHNIH